jgi:hypothetical protein
VIVVWDIRFVDGLALAEHYADMNGDGVPDYLGSDQDSFSRKPPVP